MLRVVSLLGQLIVVSQIMDAVLTIPFVNSYVNLKLSQMFWQNCMEGLLDRVPTRTCLSRRGVVNPLLCVMCQLLDESSQHLFIECVSAQRVWNLCFRWIGIRFVQHKDVKHTLRVLYCNMYPSNRIWFGKVFRRLWYDVSGIREIRLSLGKG